MPALDPELKKAIVHMPGVEKDKLLLRLVAKDAILTEKLQFELVERGQTIDDRRTMIRDFILRTATLNADTPGWLMMDMRTVSGYISRHLKVTKDKYGEVELMLSMLNTFYDHNAHLLHKYNSRSDKAAEYIAKRTDQVLKKAAKLDPDYHIEFASEINKLLLWIHGNAPAHYARQLGLPKEWMV
ncbi:hypothetical protein [Spirosoma utsteinense]|uniref:Uncharacterized protein n=1 Tax=Spirosoma utsteinense TaxID=2585773 RepID=A0ABR6W1J0_9BACT|nr:hypothetical protein [Spirosoma utsteinense]MBC3784979.1 hypothetical protein [Spirosoma utsteinense]MBC3790413.1 hypothetical protein [Spirosoma utsteinense]